MTQAEITPDTAPLAEPDLLPGETVRRSGVLRRALRLRRTQIGLVMFVLVVGVAVVGPFVAPHSPTEFVGAPFDPPSSSAWLGTDSLGRDVLSRVLHGGWTVLWMSFSAAALGLLVGIVIGMTAGFARKAVDDTIMAGTDLVLAFPSIVLVLMVVSLLGTDLWLIVLLTAASHAPRVARLSRGLTMDLRGRSFVEAAEVLGVPRLKVLFSDILPSMSLPLSVEFGLRLTWSVLLIASLSFLGFGVQAPQSDWGLIINENRTGISISPLAVLAPATLIAMLSISVSLVSEGLGRTIAGTDRTEVQ
ncbi:ABC transporter permease [Nocardioides sp. GY 10127]|uniref:ABC transporter permease n=1 Tax=Nocardioides sp. GY 10127 TaxID=2569762 RepID=UPI0010A7C6E4|nr:ABC transporter permease [Nocardioides sp. GY 10127]TIC85629.1 ABC transporter permease [Nocardioides sp. GY 10127]